ncbi:hypothetical protein BJ508DRAFT_320438 [Ascobolus immersus RN42]|uniref:Uncharacterized protein n=1 Tax=Ascobolus immersus RN42 TaxID=1160509 RepID=A0A3N4INF0_ASCIM|nr:hypothetical protein BJ508DRAFT_320438 [Ascobolus immersus RN42]
MKFFSTLTTFLAVAASAVIASPVSQVTAELASVVDKRSICDTPTGSCSFYETCLENKYKCGSSGYPLNYGYNHTSGSTCAKIEKAAFASHSVCYLGNGVCDLGLGDLWDIFRTVGISGLFGGWDNLIEAAQTAAPCLAKMLMLV